mgnify:CR=1 FL=1
MDMQCGKMFTKEEHWYGNWENEKSYPDIISVIGSQKQSKIDRSDHT